MIHRGSKLMRSARRSYSMAPCVESVFGERPKSKTVEILTSIRVPKRMKKLQINSAVMIPLCVKDGGRLEAGETSIEAALREANEEIGLDPRVVDVWGVLPGGIPDSRFKFAVQGVLVDIGDFDDLDFQKSDDEVQSIFTLTLEELVESSTRTKFRFNRNAAEPTIYDYELPSYKVEPRLWGMSAMFTNFVMAIVTRGQEQYLPGRSGLKIPSFTDDSDDLYNKF